MDRLYGDINMILTVWNFSLWVIEIEPCVGLGKPVRVGQQAIKCFLLSFVLFLAKIKN